MRPFFVRDTLLRILRPTALGAALLAALAPLAAAGPTSAPDPARGGALGWSVDTVAVIGDAFGSDAYVFSRPSPAQLAGTADGGVVLVDDQSGRVLEYGPDGRHRATYGRAGGGPGELRQPTGLAVDADTVWVNDFRNRRVTGFPRVKAGRDAGEPRSVPYAAPTAVPGVRLGLWDGGFIQEVREATTVGKPVPEPLLRLDRDHRPVDTLWIAPATPVDVVPISAGDRTITLGLPRQLWPELRWAALSDGRVAVSAEANYVIRVVGRDGEVERVIRHGPPARRTTDADREAVRDREVARLLEGDRPTPMARRLAESRAERMTFADRVPRVVALRVDPRDRIWVGVSEDRPDTVQRIDVWTADGTLLGELRDVPMPDAFAGTDRILTVRTDELDVPQVVVLEVNEDGA